MTNLKQLIEQLIPLFNFKEVKVDFNEENRRISFIIEDDIITQRNLSEIVIHFHRVFGLVAKKFGEGLMIIDVNNFRKEREKFIVELAKAGAKKAAATKSDVVLPPMNAYERRLIHSELSIRPDIKTESIGQGSGRQVVIKFLE